MSTDPSSAAPLLFDEKSRLRVELLKLVHRFDHSAVQVVERAKELEAYVLDAQPTPRKGRRSEPSGN